MFNVAVDTLPLAARAKAKKLIPHLLPLEESLKASDLNVRDLLYDLTVNSKTIKTPQRETLMSIIRQLDGNSEVNKRLYFNKLNAKKHTPQNMPDPGHPKKARIRDWQKLNASYFTKHRSDHFDDGIALNGVGGGAVTRRPAILAKRHKRQHDPFSSTTWT